MTLTPEELRTLFPTARAAIHLNHAGCSPVADPVADAVRAALDLLQSPDPTAAYFAAMADANTLRAAFGRMMCASLDALALVKNTSQALSLFAQGIPFRAGENVVVAANEYPSNVYPWLAQEARGVQTKLVPPRADGYVDEGDLEAACDAHTRVLAVSWVQWGTGQRMDLARLAAFCQSRNLLLAVDAVQGLGALRLDLSALPGVAFAAAGGHKWLLAPGGVGVMYLRPDLLDTLLPTNVGWNWVANPMAWDTPQWNAPKPTAARYEEGTPSVLGIAALLASVTLLESVGFDAVETRVLAAAAHLRQRLGERGMHVVSPHGARARTGIVAFRHPDRSNDAVLAQLTAAGVNAAVRCGNVRFAPHAYTSAADVERAIGAI